MDINAVKKNLAEYVVEKYVKSNMTLGLGTGSTCEFAIKKIAELTTVGKITNLKIVPTSSQTRHILDEAGIAYYSLNNKIMTDAIANGGLDISIDGADEVMCISNRRYLVKGGGAALLGEKTVELYSKKFVVFVDGSKVVNHFGAFPIPVEVLPYIYNPVKSEIERIFAKKGMQVIVSLRMGVKKAGAVVTDSGNYILDCKFQKIEDPEMVEKTINLITGVVECGIFSYDKMEVLVGKNETQVELL